MASTSTGVWLTTRDICLWLHTSNSPGAMLRSPAIRSGRAGSRAAMRAVSRA